MKSYHPPTTGFKFPFRLGSKRQLGTGRLNMPKQGRPSKTTPPIKQFSQMKAGRPAPKAK